MAGATIHAFPARPAHRPVRTDSRNLPEAVESGLSYLLLAGTLGIQIAIALALAGLFPVGH